jgi:hypothetical protein
LLIIEALCLNKLFRYIPSNRVFVLSGRDFIH